MILVIGAGSIGRRHAANIESLGRKAELLPWRSLETADLDGRRDVAGMVIATGTSIRLPLIQIAARNDWPVYVEKPLAYQPEDIARIYEAITPVIDRSLLGFMMRYHPVVRELACMDLSTAYGFHFEIGHDVRRWREGWKFADSYAASAMGGGVLLDLCHEIDMAECVFPGIRIGRVASLGHDGFPGVDFVSRISLAQENGAAGEVAMDYVAPEAIRRISIRTEDRTIDADLTVPEIRVTGAEPRRFEHVRNSMFLAAMSDFLALVDGQPVSGNSLIPRLDAVRRSTDLIASAWASRRFVGSVSMDMG